jgi:hypothetical protein
LPWWLVTILALIAVVAAAALVSAVLDGGHHEGMPETTGTVQLATRGTAPAPGRQERPAAPVPTP